MTTAGPSRLRVPANVAVILSTPSSDADADQGHAYVAAIPDGPLVVLDGPAFAIWKVAEGEEDTVVSRVAEVTATSPGSIRADVEHFVERLVEQGFLERYGPTTVRR